MNDYRIHYINSEGEERVTGTITERSEAAARKWFAASSKECGKKNTVKSVELIREGVNATKQQERDTLEAIKRMVEELGPQSYLATAFEGCFRDAEDNIDDDAAYSMKARYESSEEKLREMSGNYVAAKRDATVLKEQLEVAQGKIEELETQLTDTKKRMMPDWLYKRLWTLVTGEAEKARKGMADSAETMVSYAECPTDIAFTSAVESYRRDKERAESCEQMAAALNEIGEEDAK